jgi:hypothetical protein
VTNDNEPESLGAMYGLIREELLHVTTSTLPWAVHLRNLYDLISNMGECLETDIVVLTSALSKDLPDYNGPGVELVASPIDNATASTTLWTCLKLPTPDALTRSGRYEGHIIKRGISRILRVRAYLDLVAFCKPSLPDYMRVISGTGRVALAIFFASYKSFFKVPFDSYAMAAYLVLGLTMERTSRVMKCPRCNEAPSGSRGS